MNVSAQLSTTLLSNAHSIKQNLSLTSPVSNRSGVTLPDSVKNKLHPEKTKTITGPVNPKTPVLLTPAPDQAQTTLRQSMNPTTSLTSAGGSSLDALQTAWGQTDSNYDLNQDGTVNVSDLLNFLANSTPPAVAEVDDASNPGSVDGLLDAWGDSDSPYDVNTDGTVNVNDLLGYLASEGSMSIADEVPSIPSLLDAWGENNTTNDVTGDGTVNVNDLLQLLGNEANGVAETGQPTLQQLLDAFGSNASTADVNADGVVNISDLLQILADNSSNVPDAVQTALQQLIDAFGGNDPDSDLDADGVVNVNDLLQMLAENG